ncbi:hypothetical protein RFI_39180 [Reticulomyxa filosa]|uniref:Uncharacterized protein n=1 Tax=Reticulomyxa filosa TaxID=46433 RepID=X6LAF0_RETFI|nr:hypothetical protein RFI_39180 [Reticulomyxa filosa]|eukprot:ETN98330.1 hypothetical protein RFI_39180 [Reticulomyxa filosa]
MKQPQRYSSSITQSKSDYMDENDGAVTPPAEDESKPRLGWGDSGNNVTALARQSDGMMEYIKPQGFAEVDTSAQKSMLRMEAYTSIDPNEPVAYSEYGAHVAASFHRMDVSFDDDADDAVAMPGTRHIGSVHAYNDKEDDYVRPDVLKRLDELPKTNQILRETKRKQRVCIHFFFFFF